MMNEIIKSILLVAFVLLSACNKNPYSKELMTKLQTGIKVAEIGQDIVQLEIVGDKLFALSERGRLTTRRLPVRGQRSKTNILNRTIAKRIQSFLTHKKAIVSLSKDNQLEVWGDNIDKAIKTINLTKKYDYLTYGQDDKTVLLGKRDIQVINLDSLNLDTEDIRQHQILTLPEEVKETQEIRIFPNKNLLIREKDINTFIDWSAPLTSGFHPKQPITLSKKRFANVVFVDKSGDVFHVMDNKGLRQVNAPTEVKLLASRLTENPQICALGLKKEASYLYFIDKDKGDVLHEQKLDISGIEKSDEVEIINTVKTSRKYRTYLRHKREIYIVDSKIK